MNIIKIGNDEFIKVENIPTLINPNSCSCLFCGLYDSGHCQEVDCNNSIYIKKHTVQDK